jgi:hypothetical protein
MDWKSAIVGGLAIVGAATVLMVIFGFVAQIAEERRRHRRIEERLLRATIDRAATATPDAPVDISVGRLQ